MFHRHSADLGKRHAEIQPRIPGMNGKAERPHRADGQELHRLFSSKDDTGLNKKISVREKFYNPSSPHASLNGETRHGVLEEKLKTAAWPQTEAAHITGISGERGRTPGSNFRA
jgi:hypothetical protein